MKKIIFGIFSHPDDEAFGPCGTLLMEKLAGNDVHLICATAGESGVNPDNHEDLAAIRLEEWKKAGKLIGADSMHHLGYTDGRLCNEDFHNVARDIDGIIRNIIKDAPEDSEIEFMSIDLNGVTGHLDHIFIGRVACYVFCNLKKTDTRATRIRLACLPKEYAPESNCDWIYMDAGRSSDEIGEIVDARKHIDTVYSIMRAHHTQRSDCEAHIARLGENVAINHFLVIE
jgi:LmbE family N-acetylglucosaminyl deacetylase